LDPVALAVVVILEAVAVVATTQVAVTPAVVEAATTTQVAVASVVAVETMTQAERHLTAAVDLVARHQTQSPTRAVAVEEETMMMADGHRAEDRQPVLVATQQMMTRQ
jgi:hypothetical protein